MSVASDLRASVLGLMDDMGQPILVQRIAPGSYDPATGLTLPPTTTAYPGTGSLGSYADRAIDGAMIQQFDRKVTWVAKDVNFVPRINDRILVGSDVYVVVNLKTRETGGEWICHTLQVRRGAG